MAKKKSSPAPRKPAAAKAAEAAEPVAPPVNGTAIMPAAAAPTTNISLEFGIENLVAIGVVHVENSLGPVLEQQVSEVNRLGNEITVKAAELRAVYDKVPIDPEFEADCRALVAVATKLGIRLTFALTKDGFNPDNLAYRVSTRFSGDMNVVRNYTVDDDHAHELHGVIDVLRNQQAAMAKAAAQTKSQLNPSWLNKQLRAAIALNAMNQTESGADTVKALIDSIDRSIKASAGLHQLTSD
jgi:hypothetical protein